MSNVTGVSDNQRIPLPKSQWYQTEKAAKIADVAIPILLAIGIAAAIVLTVSGIKPLVITGIALLVGCCCVLRPVIDNFFDKS